LLYIVNNTGQKLLIRINIIFTLEKESSWSKLAWCFTRKGFICNKDYYYYYLFAAVSIMKGKQPAFMYIFLISDRQWGTEHQYLLSIMIGKRSAFMYIFLISDRQWGTEHQYLLSRFLGVPILQLQLLIIYPIYDYVMCRLQWAIKTQVKPPADIGNLSRLSCLGQLVYLLLKLFGFLIFWLLNGLVGGYSRTRSAHYVFTTSTIKHFNYM
jgi:hypothetical protein